MSLDIVSSVDPTNSNDHSGATCMNMDIKLANGRIVHSFGLYSTHARTYSLKICQRQSATTWDVMQNESFIHYGTGWEMFSMPTPYTIPSTGDFYIGYYYPILTDVNLNVETGARSTNGTSGYAPDITGTGNTGFIESTGHTVGAVRVMYDSNVALSDYEVNFFLKWDSLGNPYVVDDGDHVPVGVRGGYSACSISGNYIVVIFLKTYYYLTTAYAVCDETLVANHINCGPSISFSSISIAFCKEGVANNFAPSTANILTLSNLSSANVNVLVKGKILS